MKHYICGKLAGTLNFLPDGVNFCCGYAQGPGVIFDKNGSFNLKKIIKEKKHCINQLKYGKIPDLCSGCVEYKETHFKNFFDFLFSKPQSFLIKEIIVNHFKQCDCSCIYCAQKILRGGNFSQNYELLPVIKQLYKNNNIDAANLRVEFQGGNVSVLKEFEPLMREFIKNGCRKFNIFTNGIKYLSVLEEAPEDAKIDILISLDAGTKETFKKIKQQDAFDKVIDNIKQYKQKTNADINLKYIIIKDVNDNIDEMSKFLEVIHGLGRLNSLSIEIDFRDTLMNQGGNFTAPEHYKDLVRLAEDYARSNNIDFVFSSYSKQFIKD